MNLIFLKEENLTVEERNKLKDNQFGIPKLRKYPLNDLPHTLQAIRFFNKCENSYKKELTNNIINSLENFQYLDIYLNNNPNSEFTKYCKKEKLIK